MWWHRSFWWNFVVIWTHWLAAVSLGDRSISDRHIQRQGFVYISRTQPTNVYICTTHALCWQTWTLIFAFVSYLGLGLLSLFRWFMCVALAENTAAPCDSWVSPSGRLNSLLAANEGRSKASWGCKLRLKVKSAPVAYQLLRNCHNDTGTWHWFVVCGKWGHSRC